MQVRGQGLIGCCTGGGWSGLLAACNMLSPGARHTHTPPHNFSIAAQVALQAGGGAAPTQVGLNHRDPPAPTQVVARQRDAQRGAEEGQRLCGHKAGAGGGAPGRQGDHVAHSAARREVVDRVGSNLDEAHHGTRHLQGEPGAPGAGDAW